MSAWSVDLQPDIQLAAVLESDLQLDFDAAVLELNFNPVGPLLQLSNFEPLDVP